jgi:hypothetical protein
MQAPSPLTDIVYFGLFQLDLKARELHKATRKGQVAAWVRAAGGNDVIQDVEARVAPYSIPGPKRQECGSEERSFVTYRNAQS